MKYLLMLAILVSFSTISHAQKQKVKKCIIENGVLKEIEIDYDTKTGDYFVTTGGTNKLFDEAYPSSAAHYAAGATWYINNEPIVLDGKKYVKYGLPRVLGVNEIAKHTDYKQVGVYVEAGSTGTPEIIYLPVRTGCEFQPYQKEVPPCNVKITLTSSAAAITGGDVVFSVTTTGSKEKLNYSWGLTEDNSWQIDATKRIKGTKEGKKLTVSTKGVKKQLEVFVDVSIDGKDCSAASASKVLKVKK